MIQDLKAITVVEHKWTFGGDFIVFTSKDEYIPIKKIQCLESEIYRLIAQVDKATLENNQVMWLRQFPGGTGNRRRQWKYNGKSLNELELKGLG